VKYRAPVSMALMPSIKLLLAQKNKTNLNAIKPMM
jgi:hypothetical protein